MEYQEAITQFILSELMEGDDRQDLAADEQILLTGLVSSVGIVRLVNFIEDQFNLHVRMKDVTIENFGTVNRIAHYLEGLPSAAEN